MNQITDFGDVTGYAIVSESKTTIQGGENGERAIA
jgi:hypothetical protein